MKHLRPINLSGNPVQRRPLKTLPSLSCDYPNFYYGVDTKPALPESVAPAKEVKKDRVAA